ncbi:sucrase ferredoxin [Nocardioides sp.]|uniref:sucrase ferredoxin n=1 Tax=Nocardioides sp. TaxID=35761 RepID=UPI002ED014C9
MNGRFRCSLASAQRDDELAGTASTVRAFLLVECIGSWGVDALRDSRLPEETKRVLRSAKALGVRANLVRRHRVSARQDGVRVFAAYADPVRPWLETTVLDSPAAVADLDLTALGAGRSPGLTPVSESVFGVCTHGRHDACCAELGRPVATALSHAQPDATWEISHIGGDRFAGNLLVLPHGLYYGRVDPPAAVSIAATHRSGHLDLDHLRGRSSYPMSVQAAEIALRRQLGETALDTVRPVSRRRDGAEWHAVFDVGAERWEVVLRSALDETVRHRLTCLAVKPDAIPRHDVLAVRRLGTA